MKYFLVHWYDVERNKYDKEVVEDENPTNAMAQIEDGAHYEIEQISATEFYSEKDLDDLRYDLQTNNSLCIFHIGKTHTV